MLSSFFFRDSWDDVRPSRTLTHAAGHKRRSLLGKGTPKMLRDSGGGTLVLGISRRTVRDGLSLVWRICTADAGPGGCMRVILLAASFTVRGLQGILQGAADSFHYLDDDSETACFNTGVIGYKVSVVRARRSATRVKAASTRLGE